MSHRWRGRMRSPSRSSSILCERADARCDRGDTNKERHKASAARKHDHSSPVGPAAHRTQREGGGIVRPLAIALLRFYAAGGRVKPIGSENRCCDRGCESSSRQILLQRRLDLLQRPVDLVVGDDQRRGDADGVVVGLLGEQAARLQRLAVRGARRRRRGAARRRASGRGRAPRVTLSERIARGRRA